MRTRFVTAVALVFMLNASAIAGPVIGTPALRPPSGGRTRCFVSNISATKTLEYRLTHYRFDGTPLVGPAESTLAPGRSINFFVNLGEDAQAHCVVEVLKGGKIARLGISADDSTGALVATMSGN